MADIQQMAPVMSDADREVARTLRREKVSRVVRYVVLIFVGLLMLYPLAWMFFAVSGLALLAQSGMMLVMSAQAQQTPPPASGSTRRCCARRRTTPW